MSPSGSDDLRRVFFALYPSREAAREIGRLTDDLRRRHGLAALPVAAGRLHVSLNFLGVNLPDQVLAKAADLAARVSHRRFTIAFDRVASFQTRGPARKPLVLLGDDGVFGAFGLHGAIHQALCDGGFGRRAEPAIEPHVTLLRDHIAVAERFVPPIAWVVDAFVLIESPKGRGEHRVLGRWPLVG